MGAFFISDLHLDHKRIISPEFSGEFRQGTTLEEHNQWLEDRWNAVVTKRDHVYVLGDVAFSRKSLKIYDRLKGSKSLILGNHDKYDISEYAEHFDKILPSLCKLYRQFWISHAPIHPDELRGFPCVHGHVHTHSIQDHGVPDRRYYNVCVEPVEGTPVPLETIRKWINRLPISMRDRASTKGLSTK
jgi:calcineurin-like phosphoesterase family protein